jgi:hypothetical protein
MFHISASFVKQKKKAKKESAKSTRKKIKGKGYLLRVA